ncbi:hypothetical protein EV424DRAFT_1346351 [Suillus variegatus]|nr:hypothetical protein EV424DRAFT_1346351 [Suillus variegatus]
MWGSSTRNSRIERLWVEVGTQFVRCWRAFFNCLERLHSLDIEKTGHLWLLQNLFLDAINDDCKTFHEEWNLHPIAGPSTNNKSPQDLRLIGTTAMEFTQTQLNDIMVPMAKNRLIVMARLMLAILIMKTPIWRISSSYR